MDNAVNADTLAQLGKKAEQLDDVFTKLRQILARFADELEVTEDRPGGYNLNIPGLQGPEAFFAAVHIRTSTVNLYLMSVYIWPELLKDMSETLRKRMQGKSCFNFRHLDEPIIQELENLVEQSFLMRCGKSSSV